MRASIATSEDFDRLINYHQQITSFVSNLTQIQTDPSSIKVSAFWAPSHSPTRRKFGLKEPPINSRVTYCDLLNISVIPSLVINTYGKLTNIVSRCRGIAHPSRGFPLFMPCKGQYFRWSLSDITSLKEFQEVAVTCRVHFGEGGICIPGKNDNEGSKFRMRLKMKCISMSEGSDHMRLTLGINIYVGAPASRRSSAKSTTLKGSSKSNIFFFGIQVTIF